MTKDKESPKHAEIVGSDPVMSEDKGNRRDIIIVGGDSELARRAARQAARKLIEAGFDREAISITDEHPAPDIPLFPDVMSDLPGEYEGLTRKPKKRGEAWRKKKHRKSDLPPGFEP